MEIRYLTKEEFLLSMLVATLQWKSLR